MLFTTFTKNGHFPSYWQILLSELISIFVSAQHVLGHIPVAGIKMSLRFFCILKLTTSTYRVW